MAPLGLYHFFHPYRHTFHQSLNFLWLYLIPQLSHSIPYLPNSLGLHWKLSKLYFDMLPELSSGECRCQSRGVIPLSFIQVLAFLKVCFGSLSYCKMRSFTGIPHSSMLDSKWLSKISTYWSAFICWDALKYPVRFLHFTNFSQITIELGPDIFINGVLKWQLWGCSKGIVAYLNYSHTQACDSYYTNCTYLNSFI